MIENGYYIGCWDRGDWWNSLLSYHESNDAYWEISNKLTGETDEDCTVLYCLLQTELLI